MGNLRLGRDITSVADTSMRREWLVTNGIGGYGMGALNLARTRRYHGMLVAAQTPPTQRQVLLAGIDTWLEVNGLRVPLITHEWATGVVLPDGYRNLESFELDGTLPVWTWTHGNIRIRQRIWMAHGKNTVYITYTYDRGDVPILLTCKPLITHRGHHSTTKGGAQVNMTPVDGLDSKGKGIDILPSEDLSRKAGTPAPTPFRILTNSPYFKIEGNWWWSIHLTQETERGFEDDKEDVFQTGQIDHPMQPGETLVIVATIEPEKPLSWQESLAAEQSRQALLLEDSHFARAPEWIQQLVLAADQFIVTRSLNDHEKVKSVIAGYPWFTDWGRDAMISLPGLTLATRRYGIAADILRTYAKYVDQGMLPNTFPDEGGQPEYNTVDATLWYFVAIYEYLQAQPGDGMLAQELYPVLVDMINWHFRGTRFGIKVDSADHLLRQGEEGVQLTWMDAKVDTRVVTPRHGKPVEVNALWYNALCIMSWLSKKLQKPDPYAEKAAAVRQSFQQKFWAEDVGYLYDVIDTPTGLPDPSIRPNQLLSISLPFPLIEGDRARKVVNICARELVGSYGLRSLSSRDDDYIGFYRGDRKARDGAYHQGVMWSWLIGPFVTAVFRVYGDAEKAYDYLQPMADHLSDACVGSVSEIFDGDSPHTPHGAIAQAWGVAEVLRAYCLLHPHLQG